MDASETAVQSTNGLAVLEPKEANKRVSPVFQKLIYLSLSLHSVIGKGSQREVWPGHKLRSGWIYKHSS